MEQNRSRYDTRGSIRQGTALLAGLVVCGRCGYTLRTRYGGYNSKPSYRCSARSALYADAKCQAVNALSLDAEVVRLAMLALKPSSIAVSLRVMEDLHQQRENAEKLWRQRLERASYEVERAARQYNAVEPENRLVARNLELAWEDALRNQRALQEQYERFKQQQPRILNSLEAERIEQLAENIPKLWSAPSTTDADRKAILREVIDRVVVNVEGHSEWVEAWVHWSGGSKTYTRVQRPVASTNQLSTGSQIVDRIKELLEASVSVSKIAGKLNGEGFKTSRGMPFTESRVRTVMMKNGLRAKKQKTVPLDELADDEWLVVDLMNETKLSYSQVHRLINNQRVTGRKGKMGRWILSVDKRLLEELKQLPKERSDSA